MIYFRDIKYKESIDCSFSARNGSELDMLERCHVGDSVSLIFDVSEHQAGEINQLADKDARAYWMPAVGGAPKEWSVRIPFVIVDRQHSFSWKSYGTLRAFGHQIFLEAKNGYWEDIFLWVSMGATPPWAEKEPTADPITREWDTPEEDELWKDLKDG